MNSKMNIKIQVIPIYNPSRNKMHKKTYRKSMNNLKKETRSGDLNMKLLNHHFKNSAIKRVTNQSGMFNLWE